VIPVALAFAEGCSDEQFHRAIAAGYAAGVTLGIGIGGAKALAFGVWPSLLAAPLMAAVTAAFIKGLDPDALAHAMALALSGASGRLGRPHGAPSGRWFAFGEAVLKGIRATDAAEQGFRGDLALVSQAWLATQAGHNDVDAALFEKPLRSMFDVGFKPFPIARQGANAVAAFQALLSRGIDPARIDSIEVFVPGMNAALLGRPASEDDRLSRISNIGFQFALAALAPEMLYDTERRTQPFEPLMGFAKRVSVTAASDLESHLPQRWAARVVVHAGKDRFEETVIRAPFDHDGEDVRRLLEEKWRHMLPPEKHQSLNHARNSRSLLWQEIERCVSMAGKRP
jgi:2-methylcitrate dehydratase PrpD